jgi:uncharacterized membrane protein
VSPHPFVRLSPTVYRWCLLVAAVAFYAVATSNVAYELTSPTSLPHHVALRKIYAVLAFTVLGALFEQSRWKRFGGWVWSALAIGAYSCAIEIGQILIAHSRETLAQHSFDVASGAYGGVLGSTIIALLTKRRSIARVEVVALVVLTLALVATFSPIYGIIDKW